MRNGETLLIDSESALLWSIVVAIQAPVFFKFGYMKSRIFAFLSLFLGFAFPAVFLTERLRHVSDFEISPLIPIILLIISAIIMVISYCISLAVFEKKDI